MPFGYQDVHLEIHSTIEALDLVQAVTEHIARRLGFDEESMHWTAMAVRESVVNAITHGNAQRPGQNRLHRLLRHARIRALPISSSPCATRGPASIPRP